MQVFGRTKHYEHCASPRTPWRVRLGCHPDAASFFRRRCSSCHSTEPSPSNPIESVFATVRHRTVRTKGALSAKTAKLMVFKLVNAAAKTWRRLKGENQLPKVVQGVKFQNGIEVIELPAHHAA